VASGAEARRLRDLLLMSRASVGGATDLECHPRYRIEVNGMHVCDYVADFAWTDVRTGRRVVEDVKPRGKNGAPVLDELARLKISLMRAALGIDVVIVT
jgi:hypothetical protein